MSEPVQLDMAWASAPSRELTLNETLAEEGFRTRPAGDGVKDILGPDGAVLVTGPAPTVWAWLRLRGLSDVELVRAMAKAARTYEHHEMAAVRAVAGARGLARIRAAVAAIAAEVDAAERATLARELES